MNKSVFIFFPTPPVSTLSTKHPKAAFLPPNHTPFINNSAEGDKTTLSVVSIRIPVSLVYISRCKYHSASPFALVSTPLSQVNIPLQIPMCLTIPTSATLTRNIIVGELIKFFPFFVRFCCHLQVNLGGVESWKGRVVVHQTDYFFLLILDNGQLLFSRYFCNFYLFGNILFTSIERGGSFAI